MHYGVLGTAGIKVYRQPVFHLVGIKYRCIAVGAGIAQEIPVGAHKGIHGVSLPLGWSRAAGAGGIDKLLVIF